MTLVESNGRVKHAHAVHCVNHTGNTGHESQDVQYQLEYLLKVSPKVQRETWYPKPNKFTREKACTVATGRSLNFRNEHTIKKQRKM